MTNGLNREKELRYEKPERRPFAPRVTVGFDKKTGKQIYKYLGYFKTKKEAMNCLAEYNLNPYDINLRNISFQEVFEKFYETKKNVVSKNRLKNYKAIFKKLESLGKMKMADIKTLHLQKLFDAFTDIAPNYVREIRSLCGLIFKYAIQMDIINKDYSRFLVLRKFEKIRENNVFTKEEQEKLWNNLELRGAKEVLILIYTGFRASEFLQIKKENIDFLNWTIKGGLKSEAGKNRIVPVHVNIKNILFELPGTKENHLSYSNFRSKIFIPLMQKLGMQHRIHDTRYTFATAITEVSQNNAAITAVIGHTNIEMTRKYSKTNIEKMRKEIEKIN